MKQKQKQPSEGDRGASEGQRECKSKREEGLGNGNENKNGMACLGNVHLDPFTVSMILRLRHSPAQCTSILQRAQTGRQRLSVK